MRVSGHGSSLRVNVKLPYRGYTISLSNVFDPPEIAIFDPDGAWIEGADGAGIIFGGSAAGIVEAAAYIDGLIAAEGNIIKE